MSLEGHLVLQDKTHPKSAERVKSVYTTPYTMSTTFCRVVSLNVSPFFISTDEKTTFRGVVSV